MYIETTHEFELNMYIYIYEFNSMLNHIMITVELLADYWSDTIGQIAENNRNVRDT